MAPGDKRKEGERVEGREVERVCPGLGSWDWRLSWGGPLPLGRAPHTTRPGASPAPVLRKGGHLGLPTQARPEGVSMGSSRLVNRDK